MSANQESRTYKYKKELISKKKAHIDGPSSFRPNDIDKELVFSILFLLFAALAVLVTEAWDIIVRFFS